jgi:hypothetical protein
MLSKIIGVPLRTVWKHEASDFTPWLSENLNEIADAIGIELEIVDIEVPVGPYYADILAKDAGTGDYVVIENQLEKTNHDHLGKCITYASVLDAKTIVWIASDVTDEHKKAMDWLNDHTSDELAFYAIKLELIKIDDSNPAINFNIKSLPNNVVKQAVKRKDNGELSETRMTQLKFWEMFTVSLKNTTTINKLQKPRPQYWFDVALGKSGVHLSNTFNTNNNTIGVRVYINNKEAVKWLPYFERNKVHIESILGEALDWNPNPDNRDKVIGLFKSFDLTEQSNWGEPINWLTKKTEDFKNVFGDLVRKGKQEL